jgi:hypothetical protein
MIAKHLTTAQWLALVAALVMVIVVMLLAWPRPQPGPDRFVVRIVDGATPISTVVVPLH